MPPENITEMFLRDSVDDSSQQKVHPSKSGMSHSRRACPPAVCQKPLDAETHLHQFRLPELPSIQFTKPARNVQFHFVVNHFTQQTNTIFKIPLHPSGFSVPAEKKTHKKKIRNFLFEVHRFSRTVNCQTVRPNLTLRFISSSMRKLCFFEFNFQTLFRDEKWDVEFWIGERASAGMSRLGSRSTVAALTL